MRLREALRFRFKKRLPAEFGRGKVIVTPRADARVLKPGWSACAHDLMLVASRLVNPGMCIWDLGANLGIFSAMAAFRSGPSGSVFALEPIPEYATLICKTASRLSQDYARIRVLCAAIAKDRGVMDFGVAERGQARNRLLNVSDDADFELTSIIQVAALSDDDFLESWPRPNIVKLDVEGAELAALQGSRCLLTEIRPIFYLEVAPRNQHAASASLRKNNYRIFHLKGDGSEEAVEIRSLNTITRPSGTNMAGNG